MLGVRSSNAEEFAKANIEIKTVRVGKGGLPRESMSFPKITIREFVKQDFEDSQEYEFFERTKFFFVVFREKSDGRYVLAGARFWNMPIEELESVGRREWESYRKKFLRGVHFEIRRRADGKVVVANDLPKKSEHSIFHMRPHARRSSYVIDGVKYGAGSAADMDILPNGDMMTHQCFWLNNGYIADVVKGV